MEQQGTILDLSTAAYSLGKIIDELSGRLSITAAPWVMSFQNPFMPEVLMTKSVRIGDVIVSVLWMKRSGPQLVLSIDDLPFSTVNPSASIAWWIQDIEEIYSLFTDNEIDTSIELGIAGDLEVLLNNCTLHRIIEEIDAKCCHLLTAQLAHGPHLSNEQVYTQLNWPTELREDPEFARQFFTILNARLTKD